MSVLAPPEPPRPNELELLIREARARQRKRWVAAAALVAVLAGAALGISSIVGSTAPSPAAGGGHRSGTASAGRCGIRVQGVRIVQGGNVVYREPVSRTFGHQIQCSGLTIWVVFFNGVASSQEAYFGVRSGDGGHSWRVVFAERYFNTKAPHQLVTGYLDAWTLDGPRAAYFTGMCVACGRGTVSLWVTKDGGRRFHMYEVPALTGDWPTTVRVSGQEVTIGTRQHKTVRLRVA